jgi:hypothetical protein
MFTEPSGAIILESIRLALRERVAGAVPERTAQSTLEAIDLMLAGLARRIEHEATWMRDEIEAVVALAHACVAAGVDGGGDIAARLQALMVEGGDLSTRYRSAGPVLNACLDRIRGAGVLQAQADAIIRTRVAHELQALGNFEIVGKS